MSQPRAVIYCRISLDATGEALGVQRQEDECRKLCATRGWDVVEVIADNSVSASTGKKRPGWEQVLARIAAGSVEVVVAWQVDRMYRSPRDLEDLVDLTLNTGVILATVSGDLDLSTPNGQMVARILGATARQEVDIKAARQKASHRQRAAAGKPWWTARPFGYERDGEIRESEAALLREAYRQVLQGGSVYGIASRWNRDGIPTPRGNAWRSTNLRHVLMQPRNAAIHTYLGSETGQAATWEALVSEDIYRAVVRLLSDPKRTPGGGGRRKGLLTGLATCTVCGGTVLQGMGKANKTGERRRMYVCRNGRCVSYPADWLDSLVLSDAASHYAGWAEGTVAADDESAEEMANLLAEEAAIHLRKVELAEAFSDGDIDRNGLRAGNERANRRASEIAERLAEIGTRRLGLDPGADNLLSVISRRNVEEDEVAEVRRILDAMGCQVALMPRGKGVRTAQPDSVSVTWPPMRDPGAGE